MVNVVSSKKCKHRATFNLHSAAPRARGFCFQHSTQDMVSASGKLAGMLGGEGNGRKRRRGGQDIHAAVRRASVKKPSRQAGTVRAVPPAVKA